MASDSQDRGSEPIQDLVVAGPSSDPTIYAAIRGRGIYRRQGGSDEWQFVARGLNSYDISDVAVDPEDPKHLYIATNNFSGVFESARCRWILDRHKRRKPVRRLNYCNLILFQS